MDSFLSQLEKRVTLLEQKVEHKEEKVQRELDLILDEVRKFQESFLHHDEKEMKKYSDIEKSINKLEFKIIGLFLIVTGVVNMDKLLNLMGIIGG